MKCGTDARRKIADACLIVLVTILLIIALVIIQPVKRGFYCDDKSIRLPYRPDTVTPLMLLFGNLIIPHLLIVCVEMLVLYSLKRRETKFTKSATGDRAVNTTGNVQLNLSYNNNNSTRNNEDRSPRSSTSSYICVLLYNASQVMGLLWFGSAVTMVITEVGKSGVGRLRPNFFDLCRPAGFNCTSENMYIANYTCTHYHPQAAVQSHKSFPSGPASSAAFASMFVVLYLQKRFHIPSSAGMFLKPALQVAILTAGIYAGVSRVADNMHHPGDVLAGSFIGFMVAIWVMMYLSQRMQYKMYGRREDQPTSDVV